MRLPRLFRPSTFRVTRTALRELLLVRKALERIADVQEAAWDEAHPPTTGTPFADGSSIEYRDNATTAALLEIEGELERQYGPGRVTEEMVVAEWEARQR